MGAIKGFLSNYSANFQLALILWPMASFVLTLPILAYLYHRDGRLKFSAVAATYLAILYLMGLGCFTLWPLPSGESGPGISYGVDANFNPLQFIADIQKDGLPAVFQLLFNVALFMPLGLIAGRLLRMRLMPTIMLSLAVSALIEVAQFTGLFGIYAYAYRCCDIDDLITNVMGGALGWLAASAIEKAVPQKAEVVEITKHPGFVRRCVALWIDLLLAGIAVSIIWMVIVLVLYVCGNREFAFAGLNPDETQQWVTDITFLLAFLVVEVVLPWRCGGKTPGGAFVHMTCESHVRTPSRRTLFYTVRAAVLLALFLIPWLMVPILCFFYLIARKMPYEYLP